MITNRFSLIAHPSNGLIRLGDSRSRSKLLGRNQATHTDHRPHVEERFKVVQWIAGHGEEIGVVAWGDPSFPTG